LSLEDRGRRIDLSFFNLRVTDRDAPGVRSTSEQDGKGARDAAEAQKKSQLFAESRSGLRSGHSCSRNWIDFRLPIR